MEILLFNCQYYVLFQSLSVIGWVQAQLAESVEIVSVGTGDWGYAAIQCVLCVWDFHTVSRVQCHWFSAAQRYCIQNWVEEMFLFNCKN